MKEDIIDIIEEYFKAWVDLFRGYFFKKFFGWVREKSEKEDWNGLIKVVLYPTTFVPSVVVSVISLYLLIVTPLVFPLVAVIVLSIVWVLGIVWKGIVWLDKKLRF